MVKNTASDLNTKYIVLVSLLTFVLPVLGSVGEILVVKETPFSIDLIGKWFIFSAVGLRLSLAGLKQSRNPAFTAKEIFHIENPESFPIIRELGFANLCFGLVGLISLFLPDWRIVSAFASGLFYGIAGLQHFLNKPVGTNETFAMVTDVIISLLLFAYFVKMV